MSHDINKSIGGRISFLRKEVFHMTQAEFSSVLGIGQGYLSQIETGARGLSSDGINNISEKLCIDKDLLYPDKVSDEAISEYFMLNNNLSDELITNMLSKVKSFCDSMNYSLTTADTEFISRLMQLSETERNSFYKSLSILSNLWD